MKHDNTMGFSVGLAEFQQHVSDHMEQLALSAFSSSHTRTSGDFDNVAAIVDSKRASLVQESPGTSGEATVLYLAQSESVEHKDSHFDVPAPSMPITSDRAARDIFLQQARKGDEHIEQRSQHNKVRRSTEDILLDKGKRIENETLQTRKPVASSKSNKAVSGMSSRAMVVPATVRSKITVVNGTFELDSNYTLSAVDEDLQVCLALLASVEQDLLSAKRQLWSRRTNQQTQISTIDLEYLERCIERSDQAALYLGKLIRGYGTSSTDRGISTPSRFKWVLQGKYKSANRAEVLRIAHTSLVRAIQRMGNVTPFMKSQPDEEHINQSIPLSSMRDEDPREALLKYAELAKKDPLFTNAWKDTQPATQYRDLSDEEEDDGPDKKNPITSQLDYPPPPPPYNPPSYLESYSYLGPQTQTKILRSPSQQRALKGKSSLLLRPEDRVQDRALENVTVSEAFQSSQTLLEPSSKSIPRERDLSRPMSRERYGSKIDSVEEESELGEYIGGY
ncbi:uncharacterized protein LY89DRAFT_346824 [Mollisia scopiformis]|uniref:Uncharacterized protein n=1 Tax=Mollisia scopiformis TaxID=149040 RepID=A0A132B8I1_MOLSC|nr:uncharacterized protein LY89DRAFT_346824 [Mollisia scopiformis]KUJ07977.1 hypothetical protein LY89DRAFT_346824 [Mollisia scopiformis]